MRDIPIVNVPKFILDFCRRDEQDSSVLLELISKDQFLLNLILASYPHELKKKSVKEFILGLGVDNALLNISGIYSQKILLKSNPGPVIEELLKKMRLFYNECMKYSDDSSRAILLTCYLAHADCHIRAVLKKTTIDLLNFPNYIKTIMSGAKNKIYHIDFLYLLIYQLEKIESLENIQKFLVEGKTFINLYKTIAKDKQEIIIKNFINYGQSINETDFFVTEVSG